MPTAKLKNIQLIFPAGPTFNNNSIFFSYRLTILSKLDKLPSIEKETFNISTFLPNLIINMKSHSFGFLEL
jgi:hypothetical protein